MKKSELQNLIKSVVKSEMDSLREDMINMLAVVLDEVKSSNTGKSSIHESRINKHINGLDLEKIGATTPAKNPRGVMDVLKQTLDEGNWRQMDDVGVE